jgi:non-heme chloroperoxidase
VQRRTADRPKWYAPNAAGFFGTDLPGITVSLEFTDYVIRQCLEYSARAPAQFSLTGFTTALRDELQSVGVPALIVHGDHDLQAPLELCGRKTAQLVPRSTLRVYENAAHGLFVTHAEN